MNRWTGGHRLGAVAILTVTLLEIAGCARPPRGVGDDPARTVPASVEYTVRDGDDWRRISETFFGDASEAGRLARENGGRVDAPPPVGRTVVVRIPEDRAERVRAIDRARGAYNAGVDAMQRPGEEETARAAFEQALRIAPHFVDARYDLGLVLLRMDRPKQAREHLEQVLRQRPDDPDVHYALGAADFHLEAYPRALTELDRALAERPGFLRARFTRAMVLQRMGRTEDAVRAWRDYLERDSQSPWAEQARQHLRELGA